MVRRVAIVVLSCGILVACARQRQQRATTQQPSTAQTTQRTTPTAERLYLMGEAQYDKRRYADAVRLWRHALLQLPQTPAADDLRHKLILRMTYGLLMAHAQSQDRAYLENAQRMLYRYLAKHEELFGDGDAARAERGDVYELLYHVESQLEAAPEPDEAASPASIAKREPEQDTHAGEALTPEIKRNMKVRTGRWFNTDVNDPRIRERLTSPFSDAFAGLVLSAPGLVQMNEPRPLLRQRRPARLAELGGSKERRRLARRLGRDLFLTARPSLKTCYEAAMVRRPVMLAHNTVEVTVDEAGQVSRTKIVDGGLVDGLGDACLIERLELARVRGGEQRGEMRIRLAMTFFWQGATFVSHDPAERVPPGTMDAGLESWIRDPARGSPPIDAPFFTR